MSERLIGVLVNWKRRSLASGVSLTLNVAPHGEDKDAAGVSSVTVIINEYQLYGLAQDLRRAAAERGIELRTSPKWKFW